MAFVSASVFFAPGAFAAEGGDPSTALLWNAVNFTILCAVLFFVARKPVLAFFADRRTQVESDVQQAASLLRDAEASHAEWQRKLVELDDELDQIRRSARNRAEQEREQILAEARTAAERIQTDAVAAVEQELRRAKGALRDEAADLALELAAELIDNQITDGDRDRLMDEFIIGVERPAGAGR